MNPILQYRDLVEIPVRESGEPMMVVQKFAPEILCRYEKMDMVPYLGNLFVLREGAMQRLKQAAKALRDEHPPFILRLAYAYRHPDVQRAYFEKKKKEIAAKNPSLSNEELVACTHLLVASPDVAGHPTGGAIDVTIMDGEKDLNMGSGIADFSSDKIKTFAEGLTASQRNNRDLLRRMLMDAGFAPFNGEWWHFSYGDREWAAYTRQPEALYDQIAYGNKK